MNAPSNLPKQPGSGVGSSDAAGRRRFLGAGAVVAPVILTLASQPALGVTCFTPSRSLSRNTSVSQQGQYGECTGAESPGNYKSQSTPGDSAYHWPIDPNTPFHPTFSVGVIAGTSFKKQDGQGWVSMSMLEVLNADAQDDPDRVAFHLIGAYLNCLGGAGASISPLAITKDGVLNIWQEYAAGGYYEPFAGVKWYATEIKKYLLDNGIVK